MHREQLKKRGRFSILIFLIGIMLFLSACAQTGKDGLNKDTSIKFHTKTFTSTNPVFPVDTKITIGSSAKSANETLQEEENLEQVLSDYGAVGANLKQKIENLQNANGNATKGLGGIYGHIFLEDAKKRLKGPNWNSKVSVAQDVRGQITNFYRDEITKAGLFHVTTLVTTTLITPGNPSNPPTIGKDAYHWQVEVASEGFQIHKNCHKFMSEMCDPNDPTDKQPFWKTEMELSDDMLNEVVGRNFHYKLWAKGDVIEVKNVYKYNKNIPGTTIPVDPSIEPDDWDRLDDSDGSPYSGLYAESPESCIDMMTVGIPPTSMSNLPPLPFYCLGRCEQPMIVNSR